MNLNKNNCDKEILGSGNAQTAVVRETQVNRSLLNFTDLL